MKNALRVFGMTTLVLVVGTGVAMAGNNLTPANKSDGMYETRKERGLVKEFKPFKVESEFWKKELDRSGLGKTGQSLGKTLKNKVFRNHFADFGAFLNKEESEYKERNRMVN